MAAGRSTALRDVSLRDRAGEYVGDRRAVGLRQVDAAAHARLRRHADRAARCCFDGRDVGALPDAERSRLRLREIGFVFQRFFLLPMLTAWENVELPQAEAGVGEGRAARAHARAARVRRAGRPRATTGRRSCRAARCSASRSPARWPTGPRLLLADEPTGELDQATGEQIAALFDRVHADGTAVVVVTHDPAVAARGAAR